MATPKEDAEELMNHLLPLAKRMLLQQGEFYPYGGYMATDGKIVHAGAEIEGTDHPESQPLIDLLKNSFREKSLNEEVKATAVIFDVRIKQLEKAEKTDAVQVCLDHVGGYSVEVLFPYKITDGKVSFGSGFTRKGAAKMFER